MKRFHCLTFGCRVNQYETQAIREQLEGLGYHETPQAASADWAVINSCTVTSTADRECLRVVETLARKNPRIRLLITGCLAQRDSALLKGLPGVRLLVGTGQKHRIGELLLEEEKRRGSAEPRLELELGKVYSPLKISTFAQRQKAILKVQDGCDRACAFCKIPYVRGRARSRPLTDVLEEAGRLVAAGFIELILSGVAVGLWGVEESGKGRLGRLLEAVDRLPGRFRIRLSSLDPRDVDDEFLQVLVSSRKICRHLHLSLQSGSDSVLRRMNRGYTTEAYAARVQRIRRFWPDAGLTTDLIVGFPGETREHFEGSLEFCRRMEFAKIHVFPFSRRRGTAAWGFSGAWPAAEVKARASRAREVSGEVARSFFRRFPGTQQEVVMERGGVGYTSQFVKTRVTGFRGEPGRLVRVRIDGLERDGLSAHFLP